MRQHAAGRLLHRTGPGAPLPGAPRVERRRRFRSRFWSRRGSRSSRRSSSGCSWTGGWRGAIGVGWLIPAVALFGLALVRGVFSFFQGYLAEKVGQSVAFDLRNDLFEKLHRLSFGYHDRAQTGQLMTRMTSDVENVRQFCGVGLVNLISAIVTMAGTLVLLLVLEPRLAVVTFVSVVIIFIVFWVLVTRIFPLHTGRQQGWGKLLAILQENLAGVTVVKAFGQGGVRAGPLRGGQRGVVRAKPSRPLGDVGDHAPHLPGGQSGQPGGRVVRRQPRDLRKDERRFSGRLHDLPGLHAHPGVPAGNGGGSHVAGRRQRGQGLRGNGHRERSERQARGRRTRVHQRAAEFRPCVVPLRRAAGRRSGRRER